MLLLLQIIITVLAFINLLLSGFAIVGLRQPTSLILWMVKIMVSALSPILFLVGALAAILGILTGSMPAILLGGISSLVYLIHIIKITGAPQVRGGFEKWLGSAGYKNIPADINGLLLPGRYVFHLPKTAEPIFHQNISFYTIPGTHRKLLCDIWQPPHHVKHSGLAFIYLHGGAWTVLDKDFGTRAFFRRLTSQGHVIMDVAYRLFPETDFMGMVSDVNHAIAWLKANAGTYAVDPDNIVLGGGSSGGHIALLTAYTNGNEPFLPADLVEADLNVKGVIAMYGMADLVDTYYHTCQHLTTHSAMGKKDKGESAGMPAWIQKRMDVDLHRLGFDKDAEPGMLVPMLGGTPDEKPASYALFSPLTHVHKDCPATLLIQGEQDILAPVNANRKLYAILTAAGVPAAIHILPQTDHGFDLIMPNISPSAHNAIYDVERFLAWMAWGMKAGISSKHKTRITAAG